jgi:hypothetical protein
MGSEVLRFCSGICRRRFPTALSCAVRPQPYSNTFSRGGPVKDMTKDNLDNERLLLIVVLLRDKEVGEWGCVTRSRVSMRHAVGLPL